MHETSSTTMSQTQSARALVTLETLLDIRFPVDINLSPNGQHAAFVVRQRVPAHPRPIERIWVAETSGANSEPHPFTKGPGNDFCPRWSPDNQQLAFISRREGEGSKGQPQLYLIPAQGGEAKQVCSMPNGVNDLAWSPDGSRIAFLSLEGEEAKSDPKVITPGRHHRLWTVRPDYDVPEPATPDGITVWEYVWSPDSRLIALYYSTGPDDTDWYRGQIGIVSASGGTVQQVSQLKRQASALAWSPDGTHVAYISDEWSDPGHGSGDLFVLPVTGGEARNLTKGVDFSLSWCHWFPDGRHLLYTAWAGVTQQIGMLDVTDGNITLLDKDFVMQSYWPFLSPTPDLRAFVTIHSADQRPSDVWFGEITGVADTPASIAWRRLSRLNPLIEETVTLSSNERIRYQSVDGWEIDALFTPPLVQKNGSPPPLFVNVHGGPSFAWCDGMGDYWTQLLASAGYAVLRQNMRGSWGRGVAFADAVLGDMGGKDFQDILAGIDYLVEQGLVDGNRVAIGGWSNGGYLSAWAVTQTNRFKAAIMGAGISDWHNMHAQTNIADADIRLLLADPLENPEVYRRHSPITYAGRVTTPTLILHGENDPAVPVAQAYAFYRALRERNVPVELVVYPREGHGVSERDHIVDVANRTLDWLKRYM